MDYKPSYKIANLKQTPKTQTALIDFSSDLPSAVAVNEDSIKNIYEDILKSGEIIKNRSAKGYEPLKTLIRGILFQKGAASEHDDIVLTDSFCQSLDLICRTLTDEGDTVICEEPVCTDVINVLKINGLKVIGVPLNFDGLDTDRLESALIKNSSVKFIFTTPNFQNPSGITAGDEKRAEIYSIARRYGVAVIENDSYGDLRYQGADIESIKSYDKEGRVIYIGGFSNILYPYVTTSYICADSILTAKIQSAKTAAGIFTDTFSEILIKRFFDEFDYFDYTYDLSSFYKNKCELMLDNLKFDLTTSIGFTEPEGGFFILGTLPTGTDVNRFCRLIAERGVSIASGEQFLISEKSSTNSFRLNFSLPTDEQIQSGIKILGDASKIIAL